MTTPHQAAKNLRTTPTKPGAEDIEAMNNRVLALEWLYRLANRDNKNHTLHHTYTNLWAESPDNLP